MLNEIKDLCVVRARDADAVGGRRNIRINASTGFNCIKCGRKGCVCVCATEDALFSLAALHNSRIQSETEGG